MHRQSTKLLLLVISALSFPSFSHASAVIVNFRQAPPDPARPLALEYWVQALTGNAPETAAQDPSLGAIILDRQRVTDAEFGDYGVSMLQSGARTLSFSVSTSAGSISLGSLNLTSSAWQNIVIARNARNGDFGVFVNGFLEPTGVVRSNAAGITPGDPTYLRGTAAAPNLEPLTADPSGFTAVDYLRMSGFAYPQQYQGPVFTYAALKTSYNPFVGRPPFGIADAPEPGTFWLLAAAGLAGCVMARRKRV
jgi:hypothetical protein